MSIVSPAGQQLFPGARFVAPPVVKSARVRQRNRRWLAVQRHLGMGREELAKFLGRPKGTVRRGLAWAEAEEQARLDADATGDPTPVLDTESGLTVADVVYLHETYGPDTPLGSLPSVGATLEPFLTRIAALYPDAVEVVSAHAA